MMPTRWSRPVAFALALTLGTAFAVGQEPTVKLPIPVPKDASVNFEVEGSGSQIVKTVKQMLTGDLPGTSTPLVDKISIRTSVGSLDIKIDDLKPLIEKIHALHVVSYNILPHGDPFAHYEKHFVADGLKRVALVPGDNGVLIMRHTGKSDRFGIVVRQKESVVVLRSQGAPGLGDFGRVLIESLTRAVQQAVKSRHP